MNKNVDKLQYSWYNKLRKEKKMKNKNTIIFKILILLTAIVTGLGFAVITPVILCTYVAYWLKQTYGFDIFFVAIILGILSGIWNAYKSINYFLNKVKNIRSWMGFKD